MLLDDVIILDKLSILEKIYGIRQYRKAGHSINIAKEHYHSLTLQNHNLNNITFDLSMLIINLKIPWTVYPNEQMSDAFICTSAPTVDWYLI